MSTISALQNQVIVPSSAGSNDDGGKSEVEKQKIEFLNILIAQLQNQNPLDPMDTTEYTNQLVMYSQLDQQLEMKQGIKDLNTTIGGQSSMMALNYLGETVELATNVAPVQEGKATWNYIINGDASEVEITIVNEDDEVLFETDGLISKGLHQFELDAANLVMPDGSIGIEDGSAVFMKLVAKDSAENNLNTGLTSFAKVDGITGDGNDPYMTSGSVTFAMRDILKVTDQNVATP